MLHAELLYNLHPYSTALASLPGLAASSTMLLPCLCGLADLMGHNVLNLALESGWADAAVDLEPVRSIHPPITQPILALGLPHRGWMLKPLSLELVCGPMGP